MDTTERATSERQPRRFKWGFLSAGATILALMVVGQIVEENFWIADCRQGKHPLSQKVPEQEPLLAADIAIERSVEDRKKIRALFHNLVMH